MAGISEGVPGAKAFDEFREQTELVTRRNGNGGKPDESSIIIDPPTTREFRASVLQALGVGSNVTGEG